MTTDAMPADTVPGFVPATYEKTAQSPSYLASLQSKMPELPINMHMPEGVPKNLTELADLSKKFTKQVQTQIANLDSGELKEKYTDLATQYYSLALEYYSHLNMAQVEGAVKTWSSRARSSSIQGLNAARQQLSAANEHSPYFGVAFGAFLVCAAPVLITFVMVLLGTIASLSFLAVTTTLTILAIGSAIVGACLIGCAVTAGGFTAAFAAGRYSLGYAKQATLKLGDMSGRPALAKDAVSRVESGEARVSAVWKDMEKQVFGAAGQIKQEAKEQGNSAKRSAKPKGH